MTRATGRAGSRSEAADEERDPAPPQQEGVQWHSPLRLDPTWPQPARQPRLPGLLGPTARLHLGTHPLWPRQVLPRHGQLGPVPGWSGRRRHPRQRPHGHARRGGIEITAGLVTAVLPRVGGYLVAAWLLVIVANLPVKAEYYDVALRDFGLAMGALSLARLATGFRGPRGVSPGPAARRPESVNLGARRQDVEAQWPERMANLPQRDRLGGGRRHSPVSLCGLLRAIADDDDMAAEGLVIVSAPRPRRDGVHPGPVHDDGEEGVSRGPPHRPLGR